MVPIHILPQATTDEADSIARAFGLRPETVQAAGLRRVTVAEISERFGVKVPTGGVLIPYPGDFARVRLDRPFLAPGWQKPAKYLSPPGGGNRVYLPPNLPARTLDGTGPLVITEGEKKALRACEEGIPCIATAGIWAWKARGPDGERQDDWTGLLADFNRVAWKGRELVVLVYDSDITPDHPGHPAYVRLAATLKRRGANRVKILTLPAVLDGEKTGLDDFLARHSADDFWQLVQDAPDFGPAFELAQLRPDASLEQVEGTLRLLARRARQLDPLGRAMLREAALKELERLGLSSPARLVDAALGRPEGGKGQDGPGQAVALADTEPWPQPVDGAAVLEELVATIRHHVVFPSEYHAWAVALWVAFTHAVDAFQVAPRLAITSPVKRCGKSTLLALLQALVRRPLPSSNITAAALFRALERFGPVVLVDEADTFLSNRDELRGLLNAGHHRASAWVIRTVREDHEVRRFFVFAPVAIAMIGALPDTLADRSIRIEMRRRGRGEQVKPLRLDRLGELEPLRRKLARWAADRLETLRAADPAVPDGLHDRAADNWRPLLAIADAAGGQWPERAREAARVLEGLGDGSQEDADTRVRLLADIRSIFEARGVEELPSSELLKELHAMEDRPWGEWSNGKPMTAHALARALRPFGIRPVHREAGNGYRRADFADAWRRYLPPADPWG